MMMLMNLSQIKYSVDFEEENNEKEKKFSDNPP
jgi:hypothetical protein